MAEIRFNVDVNLIGQTYGLTVIISDASVSDEADSLCYFLVFKGPENGDIEDTAKLYGSCHREAMDSLGLEGEVSEEQFSELLDNSIELAGQLMGPHGYEVMEIEDVDKDVLDALFRQEEDPSVLN